jgi:hypothetical protein
MEVLWIIIWLVFSGACAAVARERGRSGLNWFLIALLLTGPVITLVILCSIDRKNVAAWAAHRRGGSLRPLRRSLPAAAPHVLAEDARPGRVITVTAAR